MEGKAWGCGLTRVRAYMKKTKKNGDVLKTTSIILFFKTQENIGGVSKNRMPTLMGVPFLKKHIWWVKCLPIKTGPLCL